MSTSTEKLTREIKSLSLQLVDAILAHLDRPDPEIDLVWAEEARKRWEYYKAGRISTVSYEDVMSRHRR